LEGLGAKWEFGAGLPLYPKIRKLTLWLRKHFFVKTSMVRSLSKAALRLGGSEFPVLDAEDMILVRIDRVS
jgi:hypothetical protein